MPVKVDKGLFCTRTAVNLYLLTTRNKGKSWLNPTDRKFLPARRAGSPVTVLPVIINATGSGLALPVRQSIILVCYYM